MQTQPRKISSEIGFRCMGPGCDEWIGDPRYVGPVGHAPQNLCFECWTAHWDVVEARAANGGEWTHLDEAMWLICRGLSLAEAAEVVDSHCMTLRRWIEKMRLRPELVPDWLIRMQETRQEAPGPGKLTGDIQMTDTTTLTPAARSERKRQFWRMALAICGAHGIPASIREDVAAEIAANVYRTPPDKVQALAHRIARRCLAADLGVAERTIPESRALSHAIAQYEYARRLREIWQNRSLDNEDWVGGFDYHSRQFAIENGVCPRCSAAGDFGADGGVCECGFSY